MDFATMIQKFFGKLNHATYALFGQSDALAAAPQDKDSQNAVIAMWTFAQQTAVAWFQNTGHDITDQQLVDQWKISHPIITDTPPVGYHWAVFGWVPDAVPAVPTGNTIGSMLVSDFTTLMHQILGK